MQISKSYSGTMDNLGSTSARQVSYGVTTTETTYWNRNDFINQTIADFLHNDCGVDAFYEVREGSNNKFLWIYGVPFLFSQTTITTSSVQYSRFYGPLYGTALSYVSSRLFSAATTAIYKFSLCFCGDPNNGFSLRFKMYNSTSLTNEFKFVFCKAKNMLTEKESVVFLFGNPAPASATISNCNGIDKNEDGSLDDENFSNATILYSPVLQTKNVIKTGGGGKFPLVPINFGIWKSTGFYLHPIGFDLPSALGSSIEAQTEVSISGRRFIVTTRDSPSSSYINAGLIEVSD